MNVSPTHMAAEADPVPVAQRIERLLGELRPRPHTTVSGVLSAAWLPPVEFAGVLPGLAELLERDGAAREREQEAARVYASAKRHRDDLARIRREAAEAGIGGELPDPGEAARAVDDARLRLDAAREHCAAEIVAVFEAVRGRKLEWLRSAGPAHAEAEQAQREAEAALVAARATAQAMLTLAGFIVDVADGGWLHPWGSRLASAELLESGVYLLRNQTLDLMWSGDDERPPGAVFMAGQKPVEEEPQATEQPEEQA